MSTYGDDDSYKSELTVGTSFANGRGHIEAYGSVSGNNQVRGNARPWTNAGTEVVANPNYAVGNGQPQFLIAQQVGLASAAPGGVITGGPLANIAFGPGGKPFPLTYNYETGIDLVGGSWQSTRLDNEISLVPGLNLGNAFGRVSYDISNNFEIYAQLQWASSRTFSSAGLEPAYLGNLTIAANNPFIPPSISAAMATDGVTSLPFGTSLADVNGIPVHDIRIFQREVGGADGNFNMFGSDWKWNANFEHSSSNINVSALNDPITANLKQALASVVGPAGAPVCSNPSGGCVPFDPFGTGVNSSAATSYVTGTANEQVRLEQYAADVDFSGTPFSIWAGPSIPGVWRRLAQGIGGRNFERFGSGGRIQLRKLQNWRWFIRCLGGLPRNGHSARHQRVLVQRIRLECCGSRDRLQHLGLCDHVQGRCDVSAN